MTTQLEDKPQEATPPSVGASPPGEVAAFTDARGDQHKPQGATPDVGQRDRIGWLVPTNPVWEGLQRFCGFLGLVATAPFLIIAFVLVKTTSRGPFLFSQLRRGYGGKPFLVYKIRSLKVNAEKSTALGVGRGESTVTAVGKVLRKLKIDEFPQFWNIFTGSMNIVGPRPIPIALGDELEKHIPNFAERHRVKPGLSSFGQVTVVENRLGADLTKDWGERFEAELHYIRNKSVAYDIVVIVLTSLYVLRSMVAFRNKGAKNDATKSATAEKTAERALKQQPAVVVPTPHASDRKVTRVLGTQVANLDYAGVEEVVAVWVEKKESQYVAICPVHSMVEAVLHKSHRESLDNSGLNTADGMPVVWAQQLLGHRKASRVYGPTLMMHLLERANDEGWRVGFYGGAPDGLNILVDKLRLRFPKLQVACSISPPFRKLSDEEDAEMVAKINEADPQILFIGLGCPKQERWMYEHRDRLNTVQLGVGAAFSFHAGQVKQAPAFLQKIGMEWFFRLMCEPRRLFQRYATTNPTYVFLLGVQLIKSWIFRRKYQAPWKPHGTNGNN